MFHEIHAHCTSQAGQWRQLRLWRHCLVSSWKQTQISLETNLKWKRRVSIAPKTVKVSRAKLNAPTIAITFDKVVGFHVLLIIFSFGCSLGVFLLILLYRLYCTSHSLWFYFFDNPDLVLPLRMLLIPNFFYIIQLKKTYSGLPSYTDQGSRMMSSSCQRCLRFSGFYFPI